ncbi:hypothetical protein PAMC26577_13405 [Caballeronia sordidicola]|uniref:Uncharacterized protein n=1 Tax=Caballeronia sordidicola TaxID=196367 RepID=A0A242MVA9_CABSO|nr:hypothetical protein PAMC26577_13405 [Caballeronia sordidicola]
MALKRHLTEPHALKVVGHIDRTDQLVDLVPIRALTTTGS